MRIIEVNDGTVIFLGRLGENEVTQVRFPVIQKWREIFGEGSFSLWHQRRDDPAPYPVAITTDGVNVIWNVQNVDVAIEGIGRCELIYTVGDAVAKSVVFATKTYEALGEAGDPPEPWRSWVEEVLEAADRAEEAQAEAEAAQDGAETAQGLSETAKAGAENARDNAITAKNDAVAAMNEAVLAKDAAEAAQAGAEAAQTGAETAQGLSETAQAMAEAAQAEAETAKAEAEEAKADAESAAQRAVDSLGKHPIIGENADWYTYNNIDEQYEDTGKPSRGFSPTVTVTPITGGHRITITDIDGDHSVDLIDAVGDMEKSVYDPTGKEEDIFAYADGKYSADNPPPYPVTSVNGKTGAAVLDAEAVGALPDDTFIPSEISDLTEDSNHRTVTDLEKQTWNAKQGAITDLATIRAGAALGATAVQPEEGKGLFSGDYEDLTNLPTIPDELKDLADDSTHRVVTDEEKTTWSGKQDEIADLDDIREGAELGSIAYQVPVGGIPKDAMSESVRESLGKADAAQPLISDLSTIRSGAALGATAVQPETGKGLFSGSYNDLTNKPTIPDELADLADDSTHRVVTDAEKATWNAKQSAITDLATIRSGAALGATAVQPETGKGLFSGSYNDLTNKPDIPDELADLAADASHRTVTDTEKATWNAKTNTSVLPNNSGAVKTRFRIAEKGYAGGQTYYYPLCKLPADNAGNYASAIISGRIGGWEASNMSSITALVYNRNTSGFALLDIAGSSQSMANIWANSELVIYTQSDTTDVVYIKCKNYYTFDLDVELYQNEASILYDGTYTTTPGGTLAAEAKNSAQRAELVNGTFYVGGSELSTKNYVNTELGKKQDVISDLSTIRSGASAGATAVQPTAIADMATKTFVEGKGYQTAADVETAIADMATKTYVEGKGYQNASQVGTAIAGSIADDVSTTDAGKSLSAKQGKLLNDRINNLQSIGRFLSLWNCATGMPLTNPSGYPYTYHTGDYFRVTVVAAPGGVNYMPNGATYTGTASTTVYTGDVQPADIFFYDGTSWSLQVNHTAETGVQDVLVDGETVVTGGVAEIDLTGKQDTITDLSTIRSGAALGATAVQPETGKGLFSGSYNDLTNKPTIPDELKDLADDSTHRVVTDAEKATWNAKQSAITDLATIRSGAAAGATAVQPETGKGLFSGSYNDLTNKPTIPDELKDLADDSTHRVVTDAEKATWNAKQSAITDLATIRSGAALGATAVQPETGKGLFSGSYNDLTNKPAIPDELKDLADDSTHRVVTDAEKATWSGKQDEITDLDDIREGAALGATAVQPETGKGLFSGSYNDLTNKPTIPTTLAALTGDSTHRVVTDAEKSAWNNKVDDFTLSISTSGGTPQAVKIVTVNYTTAGSEAGVLIKFGMVSGHGNGSAYKFLQDVILSVNYLGNISADVFKYYGAENTFDSTNRQFGDIFWTHDATNKIVRFYCLAGQYATVKMTPYKRLNSSAGGAITQHTGSAVNDASGNKVWGNNSDIAQLADLATKLDNNKNGLIIGDTGDTALRLRSQAGESYLGFQNQSAATLGYIGVDSSGALVFYEGGGTKCVVPLVKSNAITLGSSYIGSNGYIEGTWLRTSSATALGTVEKICVLSGGWIYYVTPETLKSALGVPDVSGKLDKTGGTISGDLIVTGKLQAGQTTYREVDAAFTPSCCYGLYQWDNRFQYTLRDTDDIYKATVFEITPNDVTNLALGARVDYTSVPRVNGTNVALVSQIPDELADLAADASHRTVTDTEKATWNAKQSAITDLATIRSGAAAGATAVQPTAITDMATKTFVEGKGYQTAADVATAIADMATKTYVDSGLSGKQGQHTAITITLTAAGWSSGTQTVSASGVTASNTVIVAPAPESNEAYGEAGIYCSAQGSGTLTFTCDEEPTSSVSVNVVIMN